MRILVTGANGYLGQGIVGKLLDRGHEVIAIDFNLDHVDKRAKRIVGDIFRIEDWHKYAKGLDAMLHLAWKNGFVHSAQSHLKDLPYHYEFLEKIASDGLKQLAVLGTMHEVGFFEGSINENTPTHPQSLYGISKDALRNASKLLCEERGICFQWIRGFYIVGNVEYGSSIFSKIARAQSQGEREFPFTMGQNQWDFLDYNEFCTQSAAIVSQNKINGIINACSGYPEKLADRVERFIADNGYGIKLKYGAYPERPYDSKAVWGDNKKILKILEDDRNTELS